MNDYTLTLLYVPCNQLAEARTVAGILLEERLIACANLIDHTLSLYRWQGTIQESQEVIMLAKTLPSLVRQASLRIKSLHTYQCPLIIQIPSWATEESMYTWIQKALT